MAKLKIRRTNQYINRYRSYQIFIDGKRAGSIPNGETRSFDVSPGKHTISARSRWGRGPEIKTDIDRDEEKSLRLGSFNQMTKTEFFLIGLIIINFILSLIWYFFDFELKEPLSGLLFINVAFYIILFGPKKYLTFKERNTNEVGI